MSLGYLDLNDCNVQLWHGTTRVQSPAYALLQGGDYLFGNSARAAARIQPRNINTRFWWQLGTEALQPALGKARHTGDLAHAHLQDLYAAAERPGEILLAVPGSMQNAQLSLLLGIMHQCSFDPVGLVNRSVALGSLYASGETLWHLELQLHQSLLTHLVRRGERLELERTVVLPGHGILQLQDRLADIVAGAFVRQTRFDPRRRADSEQSLYDALPAALERAQRDAEITIELQGYQARLAQADLAPVGQQLFASARQSLGDSAAAMIADPVAALLPGLEASLGKVQVLDPEDIRCALEEHLDSLLQRSSNLNYTTSLPCLCAAQLSAPRQEAGNAPAAEPAPTHLLAGNLAEPLCGARVELAEGAGLVLKEGHWHLHCGDATATLNGATAPDGCAVALGDRIGINGNPPILLIRVEG
ncbi:MAG: hypothetical protein R3228_02420 [Halioglobus sp.]|nr:hypothetical protein [Halioglobus sp.]